MLLVQITVLITSHILAHITVVTTAYASELRFGHNLSIHQYFFLLLGSKDCPSEALQNELKKWEENHTLQNPTMSTSRKPLPTLG